MRYYLFTVQYNREKDAENRTVPKAFDTVDEAICAFHKQMGSDMANETLGWSLCMVIDSNGSVLRDEKWVRPIEVEPEPEVEEVVTEE